MFYNVNYTEQGNTLMTYERGDYMEDKTSDYVEMTNDCMEKGELLFEINEILKVLPDYECQRLYDYLVELFFS